ncbi:MAG: LysM peptidoglycan-binding domain-containing protein [Chloroflexota bacterium]
MEEYFPAPQRRYPSPSAQRRNGEHWKARFGLGFVVILTLVSAAVMFRIAGLGVGTATSTLRGPSAGAPAGPTGAATAPSASGQQPGRQPAAAPPTQPAATPPPPATAAAAPPTATVAPSPTPRPNQREHTVEAGDTLFAISQRYGTTVDALVAANNLRSRNDTLSIGQRLLIP